MNAAWNGEFEIVKFLCEKKADVECTSEVGMMFVCWMFSNVHVL